MKSSKRTCTHTHTHAPTHTHTCSIGKIFSMGGKALSSSDKHWMALLKTCVGSQVSHIHIVTSFKQYDKHWMALLKACVGSQVSHISQAIKD